MSDIVDRVRQNLGLTAKQSQQEKPAQIEWEADLIPDPGIDRSPEQYEMDAVIDGVDMLEAYRRWIGKMEPNVGSKRKNIMISCPMPDHADKVPSADINLDEGPGGLWHCHRCGIGGDKYTIAAIRFGFDLSDYQSKENFPKLREAMAEDLGFKVVRVGKVEWLEREPEAPTPAPEQTEPEPEPQPHLVVVSDEDDDDVDFVDDFVTPGFNWRDAGVSPNTFLDTWLELTSLSYEPEEFYFFEGLQSIGCAARDVILQEDFKIRPNLSICLIGTTSTGKSVSMGNMQWLLRNALPFDAATGSGVRIIKGVGSGESLIDMFNLYSEDAATGTRTYQAVNGLVADSEFAQIMSKVRRQGSTLRETMMDFMDFDTPVQSHSRMGGNVEARNHFCQFITSTQPEVAGEVLSANDGGSGFLNRWVYVFGTPKKRPAIVTQVLELDEAIQPLQQLRAWASQGRVVKWNDRAAADHYQQWHDQQIIPYENMKNNLGGRIKQLSKKILLLLAINDRSTTITTEHVETLAAIWPFVLRGYGFVSDQAGNTKLEAVIQLIREYGSTRRGAAFCMRDFKRSKLQRRKVESTDVVNAFRVMEQMGELYLDSDYMKKLRTKSNFYQYIGDDLRKSKLSVISN